MSESVSRDVQALLAQVESYEHLAILLLAHRGPLRQWSEAELATTLKIPAQLVRCALSGLVAAGLLIGNSESDSPRYRYGASGMTDEAVGQLAQEFSQNPARVMRVLSANAIERLRASALHTFADAFVLKKRDRDRG